ncbi:MAG: DUF4430 domain-containing protein [Erysipelotrichaceae bacterium]|jgi:hypothetical protein|nr:DUF4430 domain-containing protein [Erysipelotrichaceae bacterium]
MKNRKIWIGIISLLVVIAVFLGIYKMNTPQSVQGDKAYTLEVVDKEGKSTKYESRTDAEFLSQAMEELQEQQDFSFEGDKTEYGIMITSVNGTQAKDSDKAYWAIYVNDEYGQYGADSQPVTDGDAFKLAYETYQ